MWSRFYVCHSLFVKHIVTLCLYCHRHEVMYVCHLWQTYQVVCQGIHVTLHSQVIWRSQRNICIRLHHIPLGPHGIVCLTPYFSLYVRYITSDYCLYSMSGIFLLTFCVRYITSDYLDLLGLSSLFSLPGDPLVRILNSETYICEQKQVYVIRLVLSRISCVRYTYASVSM